MSPTRQVRLPGSLTGRRAPIDGRRAPIDVNYVHWCTESCIDMSPIDRQIVEHLVLGKSSKQIGESIGLSGRTVHNRLTVIKRKLGVHSRTELVALAIKTGIE